MINPLIYVGIAVAGLNIAALSLISSEKPPPDPTETTPVQTTPTIPPPPAEKIETLKPPTTLNLFWKTAPVETSWCQTTLPYKYAKSYTTTLNGKKIRLTYLATGPGQGEQYAEELKNCPNIQLKRRQDMFVILNTTNLNPDKTNIILSEAYKKLNKKVGEGCIEDPLQNPGRNPYTDNYKRNKQTVTLSSPLINPAAAPNIFQASIMAARQQTQATYIPPKPRNQPQLAPLIAGTGSSTSTAIRGQTPKLIDPYTLTDPGYASKPAKPQIPQPTLFTFETQFTRSDPQGPGCGWAFTGTTPPVYDDATLSGTNQTTALAAIVDINQQSAAWLNNQLNWSEKLQQYTTQYLAWLNYKTYLKTKQDAQLQWDIAQRAYDESVLNYYPDPATAPTPQPSTTGTAQIPVTVPTPPTTQQPAPTESEVPLP